MAIDSLVKILIIRICSLFYFKNRSKVIFYHDIHSKKKYTNMSTAIQLFANHIQIIRESGYEVVPEITNEYGQIEICFDDAFLGLYENIGFLKPDLTKVQIYYLIRQILLS